MTRPDGKHSDVEMVSKEDLQTLKGYYYYASYEVGRLLDMLRQAQRQYTETGELVRGARRTEEIVLLRKDVEDMESLLADLEFRLDAMFLRADRLGEAHKQRQTTESDEKS